MAKSKAKKSNEPEKVEVIVEAVKQEVKGTKIFTIPRTANVDNSKTVGEFPLRTYEMFRNLFVGIN
jgi:hypothetical protein